MNDAVYLFLNQLRKIDVSIQRLLAKKEELEMCLLPGAIRYDKDKVQITPEDTISKICAEIADVENQIRILQAQRLKAVQMIDATISKIDNMDEQTVLFLRYMKRMSIKEIADSMNYSTASINRLRKKGVNHLSALLKGCEA